MAEANLTDNTVNIYVGTDRSQALAVKVLEHSIKKNTNLKVEVHSMLSVTHKAPKKLENRPKTGFSFHRFCIPQLNEYSGRAIYMDADMIVFKDIAELWTLPFKNKTVLLQDNIAGVPKNEDTPSLRKERIKQCAVMVLDCPNLKWTIEDIVKSLDEEKYDYKQLMENLALIEEEQIGYTVPSEWNSMEHLDKNTALLHYTDMETQPWVSPFNKNDQPWLNLVAELTNSDEGFKKQLIRDIDLGYLRPSLILDVEKRKSIPNSLLPAWRASLYIYDKLKLYKPHAKVFKHVNQLSTTQS